MAARATPQPGWESAEQGKPEASLANGPARGIWESERWADSRWLAAGTATGPSGRGLNGTTQAWL